MNKMSSFDYEDDKDKDENYYQDDDDDDDDDEYKNGKYDEEDVKGEENDMMFSKPLKVSVYSPCESTDTSYQDLPSICSRKSQTKFEDLVNNTQADLELDNEKDDKSISTTNPLAKTNENYYAKNLNASILSLASQSTIDSLAKRVQSLIGPVDYRKTSLKNNLPYNQNKSTIDYNSIYKELDEIQSNLRIQRQTDKLKEQNDFLDKENKNSLHYEKNLKSSEEFAKTQQMSPFSTVTKVTPFSSNANSMISLENNQAVSKLNYGYKDFKRDDNKTR